jgi:hypothetical protein
VSNSQQKSNNNNNNNNNATQETTRTTTAAKYNLSGYGLSQQEQKERQDTVDDLLAQYESAKRESSKYVRIEPGEKRILQFTYSPEKIKFEVPTYGGIQQPNASKRIDFYVIDPEFPQAEKIFSVSLKKGEKIFALVRAGHRLLEIERIGESRETRYEARIIAG